MDNFNFKKYLVENALGPFSGQPQQNPDVKAVVNVLAKAKNAKQPIQYNGVPVFNVVAPIGALVLDDETKTKVYLGRELSVDDEIIIANKKLAIPTIQPEPARIDMRSPEQRAADDKASERAWTDSSSPFYRGGD
jgi:hypothetical protein